MDRTFADPMRRARIGAPAIDIRREFINLW